MRSVSQTDSQAHHHSFEYIKLGIKFRYHRFQLCYVLKNILFQRQKKLPGSIEHGSKKSTNNAKN